MSDNVRMVQWVCSTIMVIAFMVFMYKLIERAGKDE